MTEEEGHDQESAENICGALQSEAKSDTGDPEALLDALDNAQGLVADVGVDLVSGVDVPAIDSKWVMLKSDDDAHDYRVDSPILLKDADDPEQRISYAAAMIPREPDKEGDVVPTRTVESAAHDFLKNDGGIDTDHSLIDGDGDPVESWVLKEDREFELPDGERETYPAGTWMLGVEWGADPWARIQSGELTGLSIYGMAEHVPLGKAADCGCGGATTATAKQDFEDPCWDGYTMVGTKIENGEEVPNCVPDEDVPDAVAQSGVPLGAADVTAKQLDIPLATESVVHLVYESRTAAEKASEEIGLDGAVHEHEFDGMAVFMPGESHEEFVDTYRELSEEAGERELTQSAATPDTVKSERTEPDSMGSDETDSADAESKADEQAAADDDAEGVTGIINEVVAELAEHPEVDKDADAIRDDLRASLLDDKATDEDDDDEDDDEEMEETASGEGEVDTADVVALSEADTDALVGELRAKAVQLDTVVDLLAEHDAVGAGADEIAAALDELADGGEDTEAAADGETIEQDAADGSADDGGETETAKAATPYFEKGGSATDTASKAVTDDGGASATPLSYQDLAEQQEGTQ